MFWNKPAAAAALALLACACAATPEQQPPAEAAAAAPAPPQGDAQQVSYAIGYDLGVSLQQVEPYVRLAAVNQGMDDTWQNRAPSLSEADQSRAKGELTTLVRNKTLAATAEAAGEDLPPRFSYALGVDIGHSVQGKHEHFDEAMLQTAIAEGLHQQPARLDETQRQAARGRLRSALMEEQARVAVENKTKGEAFLATNAHRIGVKTTASGLQYEVLKQARGKRPNKEQKVTVNYTGTLLDGTVFDDSRGRGQPVKFPLSRVIPGWTEGVALMPVGSRYKFYIPAPLAYGEKGAGNRIGPNEVLVFDVELVDIE
jgi:FKBP-type peptidyl-prolyl cis-trans isomerase